MLLFKKIKYIYVGFETWSLIRSCLRVVVIRWTWDKFLWLQEIGAFRPYFEQFFFGNFVFWCDCLVLKMTRSFPATSEKYSLVAGIEILNISSNESEIVFWISLSWSLTVPFSQKNWSLDDFVIIMDVQPRHGI